ALPIGLDLAPVAGDRVEQRGIAAGQGDRAHEKTERLPFGPGDVEGGEALSRRQRDGQHRVPQGRRAAQDASPLLDLPVPARERLLEAGLAQLQAQLEPTLGVELAARDEAFEQHAEARIETALDRGAE